MWTDYSMFCWQHKINFFTYSCGNRVFAVDTTGKLIWKSKQYGKTGYTFYNHQKLSPIIDPHGYIIFMDTASKVLYALSSSDGSEKSSYTFPSLEKANECSEPPFIVGNRIYWIIAQYYVKYYLFSAPLTHLINWFAILSFINRMKYRVKCLSQFCVFVVN